MRFDNLKIKFAWSTFTYDGGCCVQSIKSALDIGMNPENAIVYVQKGFPLSIEDAKNIEGLGVTRKTGAYTRRDKFFDAVAKFQSIVNTEADFCWSLDSDVVLNDFSLAEEVIRGGYKAGCCHWNTCDFSGCSTFIEVKAAQRCLDDMTENNSAKLPMIGMPDDVMMGKYLDYMFGRESVLRLPYSSLGWYKFEKNWKEMNKSKWIHFGNRNYARNVARGADIRTVVKNHMEEYRTWRFIKNE